MMQTVSRIAFYVAAIVATTLMDGASGQPMTEVELEEKLSGLGVITDIQNAEDDSLFVVERSGTIHRFPMDEQRNLIPDGTIFLDISDSVFDGGERGLLGLAFDPDYATNRYFYVNYIDIVSQSTIISRFTSNIADPTVALRDSELVLAEIEQPYGNHNGGQLQFWNGYLYVGTGDGGSGNDPIRAGQSLTTLLGKVLRVDVSNINETSAVLPRWSIPADNPFADSPSPYNAIWAYGLRNPWRFSFDRETGDMWIGDVGQNAIEEIDFQPATSTGGENYGWGYCEGTRFNTDYQDTFPGECDSCGEIGCFVPPVLEYNHPEGRSVTGGYVYRGRDYASLWNGTYFYADYATGVLWGARKSMASEGWENVIVVPNAVRRLSTFGEDRNGELYAGTGTGRVYRIKPTASALNATDAPVTIVPQPTAMPTVIGPQITSMPTATGPKITSMPTATWAQTTSMPTATGPQNTSMPTATEPQPTSMPTATEPQPTSMPTATEPQPTSMPTVTGPQNNSMPTATGQQNTSMPTATGPQPTSMPTVVGPKLTPMPTATAFAGTSAVNAESSSLSSSADTSWDRLSRRQALAVAGTLWICLFGMVGW